MQASATDLGWYRTTTGGFGAWRKINTFLERCSVTGIQNTRDTPSLIGDEGNNVGGFFSYVEVGKTFDIYYSVATI